MVSAVKNEFRSIFSIELDDVLFDAAKRNFEGLEHVRILHGDSATVLPYVLAQVHGPCLFWLDAHYSGGITARSSVDTPILDELSQIFACHHIEPVILIDDARLFAGPAVHPILDDSWLMLSDLKRFILDVRPDWTVEVQDDIIRVHRSQV